MSIASEIEQLHGLLEKGVLTQAEFDEAKAKLLSGRGGVGAFGTKGFGLSGDQWAMIMHLTVLLGYGFPVVGWIVPILIWQLMKSDYPKLEKHGWTAVNGVVSLLIYTMVSVALTGVLIGIPLLFVVSLAGVIFPVIAAFKAGKGEVWHWPLCMPLFQTDVGASPWEDERDTGSGTARDVTNDGDNLVELYRASGLPEAYALRDALEAAGIEAFVENELLQGAVGEVPLGWSTAPRIKVQARSVAAAREVLDRFSDETHAGRQESDHADGESCLACGGVMGEFNVCEECGWSWNDGRQNT